MRIIAVVTFSLPVDFAPSNLMADHTAVIEPLISCFPGFRPHRPERDVSDGAADDFVLLDYPDPRQAARTRNLLLDGTVRLQDAGTGLDVTVRIAVSSLSSGFAVLELPPCPDDIDLDLDRPGRGQALRDLEAPYRRALGRQIRLWCECMERVVAPLDGVSLKRRGEGMLPTGKMLWWHRILLDPGERVPMDVQVGVTCHLGATTCTVGYLFTSLAHTDEQSLQDCVNGLMLASQNWLIIDDATRLTTSRLMRIETSSPDNQADVDRQYDEILDLTDKAVFRGAIFGESIRYISNAQLAVKNAADQAWGIAEEGRTLTDRMSALREIFNLRRERLTNRRDEFRNKVIIALTSLTVLQTVFDWYDFFTAASVSPGPAPRPAISVATLVATLCGAAVILFAADLVRRASRHLRRARKRGGDRGQAPPPVPNIPGARGEPPAPRSPAPRPPGSGAGG